MRHAHKIILAIILLLQISILLSAQPAFHVANTLQSDMVIQQGKPLTVWGKGLQGIAVKVSVSWSSKTFTAHTYKSDTWEVQIDVPKAKPGIYTPQEILVYSDRDSVKLKNVLIGEVWLCGGQSNMDMLMQPLHPWLKGVIDYEKEIAAANYPQIRVLDIASAFAKIPADDCKSEWNVCDTQHAKDFSAVAYYFGRELFNRLHIPIGLITSTVGGTACQAWTSREALETDPILKKILYSYDTSAVAQEPLDNSITFEKIEKLSRPALLYNAMVFPLRKISLQGFIWYQGESNKDNADYYARLNIAMIKNWRFLFGNSDQPFYFVQVAPYNYQKNDTTAYDYAIFRDAQKDVLKLKNTGMVVTMDIGDADDIHPRDKKDVGVRLAQNALSQTYGVKNIVYRGPEFKNFKTDGVVVKVAFDDASIGSGLATNDNKAPKHFFIAGADKKFYYANAQIVNNEVWLTCDKVQKPVAVRYAYTNYPITNFGNREGFPCVPFRTDSW
ncbi:MAG TPA: sialate O-acetylesterase [Panacibacter sp.]|nr:sialate O-acetylesterase [Panacibacter sp.]HNP45346.1 sialate O-acetylesterase [Panacibacter sp.]